MASNNNRKRQLPPMHSERPCLQLSPKHGDGHDLNNPQRHQAGHRSGPYSISSNGLSSLKKYNPIAVSEGRSSPITPLSYDLAEHTLDDEEILAPDDRLVLRQNPGFFESNVPNKSAFSSGHVAPQSEAKTSNWQPDSSHAQYDVESASIAGNDAYYSPFDGVDSAHVSISKTSRLSRVLFTGSPGSLTRSGSLNDSIIPMKFFRKESRDEWNPEALLEISDAIREALSIGEFPIEQLESFSEILRIFVMGDQSNQSSTEISVIMYSRLDKLVEEIIKMEDKMPDGPLFHEIIVRASTLKQKWGSIYKQKFFSLDDSRISQMKQTGYLHDMSFNIGGWGDGPMWIFKNNQICVGEGDKGFKLGSWWPDIACAFRDGIVGSAEEKVTKGRYSVVALPLLTGEEVEGSTLDMYEYMRRGTSKDMPFSLLSHRGVGIRILRGHTLKSKFAPNAGVRYDGLYVVRQYGHKLVDLAKGTYQCTIILERIPHQRSVNHILKVPTKSDLDDWALYNRIVGDWIRMQEGDLAYSKWKGQKGAQIMEREDWLQRNALQAGDLSQIRLSRPRGEALY